MSGARRRPQWASLMLIALMGVTAALETTGAAAGNEPLPLGGNAAAGNGSAGALDPNTAPAAPSLPTAGDSAAAPGAAGAASADTFEPATAVRMSVKWHAASNEKKDLEKPSAQKPTEDSFEPDDRPPEGLPSTMPADAQAEADAGPDAEPAAGAEPAKPQAVEAKAAVSPAAVNATVVLTDRAVINAAQGYIAVFTARCANATAAAADGSAALARLAEVHETPPLPRQAVPLRCRQRCLPE